MAIPTVAEVLAAARAELNDTAAEVFTDTKLAPHFAAAYTALYDTLVNYELPLPRREVYYVLPAYTGRLTPAQMNVADFGEVIADGFFEAPAGSATAVTAATSATPIVATATGHPFSTNDEVIIYGVAGQTGANGRWYVAVSGASLTLRGSTTLGTFSGAGSVVPASNDFRRVFEESPLLQRTPMESLRYFEWRGDAFYFNAATSDRLLKLLYYASAAPPASGSVGIDGCKIFLATFTAGQASFPEDRPSEGNRLMSQSATHLHQLINPMVKAKQRLSFQPRKYRGRQSSSNVARRPYFTN